MQVLRKQAKKSFFHIKNNLLIDVDKELIDFTGFTIKESFPYMKFLLEENKIGAAIYNIPDFVLLTANQKYLGFQDCKNNSIEKSIDKQFKKRVNKFQESKTEEVFKAVIRTGKTSIVEEFKYESNERGITYCDITIIPVYIDGKIKYLFETIEDVSERVLNRKIIEEQNKEIEEQKKFIEKQREQLEAIINGLGDEVLILDKSGIYVGLSDLVNNKINPVGKDYEEIYNEFEYCDLDGNRLPLEETCTFKALRGEKVKNLKTKTIRDGKTRYIDNTGIPIFGKNNELEFVIRITHDITEIVEQSKKIEEQKKALEVIIESISEGISIIDDKGEFKLFNKNLREKFTPSQGYIGDIYDWYKESELFYFQGDRVPLEDIPATRIKRGEKFSNLKVSVKLPNNLIHFDVSGTPIYDNEGEFLMGVISYRDMTEYYMQEEILKSRNKFLNRLIDNLELPVFTVSAADLTFLQINQKAFDILKEIRPDIKSAIKLKGSQITEICSTFKETVYFKKIKEVIKDKKIKYLNKKTLVINGNDMYLNLIFDPVFKANGEVEEILVLLIDITAEIKSNQNMERALKSQEEFLSNISHELKTPLNVIYSTIQLFNMYCQNGSLDEKRDSIFRYINSMFHNCYRLSKIINNIVDLSKIDAGFFELNFSNNNIVEIVGGIVTSVTDYSDIQGLSISFHTDVKEKIIACDPEKINRIVLNLISNAIKFSDKGKEIFVSVQDKNEFIEISVRDNGIGIDQNQLEMIFNRFRQVDKSLTRNAEGTGIGLSLVKAIVELHNGSIYVESELGEGSKFTVVLPTRKMLQENIFISSKMENKCESLQVELSDICAY